MHYFKWLSCETIMIFRQCLQRKRLEEPVTRRPFLKQLWLQWHDPDLIMRTLTQTDRTTSTRSWRRIVDLHARRTRAKAPRSIWNGHKPHTRTRTARLLLSLYTLAVVGRPVRRPLMTSWLERHDGNQLLLSIFFSLALTTVNERIQT